MKCGKTILKIAIAVGLLSLLFQILGFTCPGWVVVAVSLRIVGTLSGTVVAGYGEVVSYTSIWYTKICIVGDDSSKTCTHHSLHDDDEMALRLSSTLNDLRDLDWTGVQIELTLAIVFCLFGLALAVTGLCDISAKLMTSLASATMLISWILILVAVITVGLAIQDTEKAIEIYEQQNGTSYTEIRVPWALALSVTGLVLALICCVLLLLSSCKQDEKTSGLITPESSRHTSADESYGYPVAITKIFMREDTDPHIVPQFNQDMLPAIGSKDMAELERPEFGVTGSQTLSDLPNEPPDDLPNDRPKNLPNAPPGDLPNAPPGDLPNAPPGDLPNDRPKELPNDPSDDLPSGEITRRVISEPPVDYPPDDPPIDYNTEALPPSTPPLDTAMYPPPPLDTELYPPAHLTRQGTTVGDTGNVHAGKNTVGSNATSNQTNKKHTEQGKQQKSDVHKNTVKSSSAKATHPPAKTNKAKPKGKTPRNTRKTGSALEYV